MSEPFIGEIVMFGGNFAPRSWAFCDGQLLSISQNTALFSILGTTYGGDGRTTFGLPDMRSRVPVHPGQGPGLSSYRLGERVGTENVFLNINQIPNHTHTATLQAEGTSATATDPTNNLLGVGQFYTPTNGRPNRTFSSEAIGVSAVGGGQSHTNVQPVLAVNFIICLFGIFPSRN